MRLRPLHDRLIVRREAAQEKTPGGIILPQTTQEQERPQRGLVLAAGPGKLRDDGSRQPMDASDGDVVLYGRYAGNEVEVSGEKLLILSESDVLAVVEEY